VKKCHQEPTDLEVEADTMAVVRKRDVVQVSEVDEEMLDLTSTNF
jgi:hypothetical protein